MKAGLTIFVALLLIPFEASIVAAADEHSQQNSIFRNPEKIVIYVEIPQCGNSRNVVVHECFDNLPKDVKILDQLTPYNLEKKLYESIKRKYTLPERFSSPELDEWGRKGQPIEIFTREEAYGEKAIEYKKKPNILFVSLSVKTIDIEPFSTSDKPYISFQTNAWRFHPQQSPYLNYNRNCLLNPYATSDQIEKDINRCTSGFAVGLGLL